MLKLSKKQDYALVLMSKLSNSSHPISLNVVAGEANLPLSILRQLANKLRQAGLISSKEGVGGGYWVAVDPKTISFAQIITAVDGPIALTDCASCQNKGCQTSPQVRKINAEIIEKLHSIKLDKLD
ncbi:MAG: Rrf2 family transcriptional regulator [Patescibacteria group bacterium]|jgi:Rrf2 family protein